MVPEIDETAYGGGISGGCLRVFRDFAGDEEHPSYHGKDGMAVVGLVHVLQAGEAEECEQLFEHVFRLATLEGAFHIEDTEEGSRLGLGEFSCGAEEPGLLPCPRGGGLFRFFGGRLLLLTLSEQGRSYHIEGFKETFLPCRRLFTGEAHCEEGEAVAGETVGGAYSPFSVLVPNGRKTALVGPWRAFHAVYNPQYILMPLLEHLSYDGGRGSWNTVFGLDHVSNGGLEDFLGGGLFYFHPTFLFEVIRLMYRFLLRGRGSSSVF